MRIIGVTGGIGSGKSTVSHILSDLGAKVIDADKLARQVVCKGQPALEDIKVHFGSGVFDNNGELDRKKLAWIVFNNQEELKVLNDITHKHVVKEMLAGINMYRQQNASLIVLDVPIPVKHGFVDTADEVWVVSAHMEVRIGRIMERSGLSREDAIKRINSQMRNEEYLEIADEVIHNNGTIDELRICVNELLEKGNT